MGNKLVISIRFHAQGPEAELYQKIQTCKRDAGLSAPEYVKHILSRYFADGEKRNEEKRVLQEVREEYRNLVRHVEETVRQSVQEHGAALMGVLGRMDREAAVPGNAHNETRVYAGRLPEEGGDMPEGALDFLDKL